MNRASPYNTRGPLQAQRYDGQSALEQDVDLYLLAPGKEIHVCPRGAGDYTRPLAVWPLDRVRVISGKLSSATTSFLRLGLEPDAGERLILAPGPDQDEITHWLRPSQTKESKQRLWRWGKVGLLAWFLALALYFSGPALLSLAASAIPRGLEDRLGKNARDQIVASLLSLPGVEDINDEAGVSPDLAALIHRLEQGAPVRGYNFDVMVLDSDIVNAFALPGGYLVLFSGLIRDCASPDELAGVLAHEMAHVTERHGTALMLRQQAWAMLARMTGLGDNLAGSLISDMLESSFSRDQEREADDLGMRRLVGAGINPMALADFFERMEKQETVSFALLRYLSSHPALSERREAIRKALEAGPGHKVDGAWQALAPQSDYSPAMDDEAWRRLLSLLLRETDAAAGN